MIIGIVCVDKNWGIGKQNDLLFHLKKDMQFFRNTTADSIVVCGYNTLLILDKQRFYCKHCNKTFTASTNVVDFHKQISNDTNLNIKLELMQKGSEKDIAKGYSASFRII